MPLPEGIPVIDLLMKIPEPDPRRWYAFLDPLLVDAESRAYRMPAEHLFKDVPDPGPQGDYLAWTLEQMDEFGIERAMLDIDDDDAPALRAVERHPERFFPSYEVDPHRGMDELRKIERLYREQGLKALTAFPAGLNPQIPLNHRRFYPVYAKCVELDIPICPCVGVPGPRVPMAAQDVAALDEVCWFFPSLRVVMRHGAEPWTALAVRLMLKYPNLHYMTSAFAPRHYPADIIEYANTRGADRVLYAGYFPMGLSLERSFAELPEVPFRDEVWPKFLRENALRVFKLESGTASASGKMSRSET